MKNSYFVSSTLISLAISAAAHASAGQATNDSEPCTDAIRRCFDFAEDSRVTCLYDTQDLKICDSNTAKEIVGLRLGLSKNPGTGQRNAYMVDGRCVERCDYQFVRSMISGELNRSAAGIRSCYENCKIDERRPMLRP